MQTGFVKLQTRLMCCAKVRGENFYLSDFLSVHVLRRWHFCWKLPTQALVILMNDIPFHVKEASWSLSSLLVYGKSNYSLFQIQQGKNSFAMNHRTIYVCGEHRGEWSGNRKHFLCFACFQWPRKTLGFFCPLHSYQNIRFSFFVLFCSQSLAPAGGVFWALWALDQ